jgi:hypothetical protein
MSDTQKLVERLTYGMVLDIMRHGICNAWVAPRIWNHSSEFASRAL